MTALSAVNSALYYCELAWIVPLLQENGPGAGAGTLLTVMIGIQVVAMLAVPAVLGEQRDLRVGLALTAALTALGFAALAPMLVGILRDATADFRLAFILLAAAATLTIVPITRLQKAAHS
ncbi:hypothetical protein [Nonomuraea rubra]|uniref:hypothetical protein n=1 Tax=Nonomuraea rubra TaxID=46180 RepID=UPI0031F07C21